MNKPHDMGGRESGPVVPETDEPAFHAEWERRAFALTLAMGMPGKWNIDMSRWARESLPGYASMSYFELWEAGVEKLSAERGLISAAEVDAGKVLQPAKAVERILSADKVAETLARGGPCSRETEQRARFKVGDHVRAKRKDVPGHTRLPQYVWGKRGIVVLRHGAHVLPDVNSTGRGEAPEHLYTVRFEGAELWGDGCEPGTSVSVDAWESYLQHDG